MGPKGKLGIKSILTFDLTIDAAHHHKTDSQ